jgi:hypothetical protein
MVRLRWRYRHSIVPAFDQMPVKEPVIIDTLDS